MRRATRAAAAMAAALLVAGCASQPRRPPVPIDTGLGGLIVRVKFRGRSLNPVVQHAQKAFFARVLADNALDVDHPLPVEHRAGNYLFVFNLSPGKYAPLLFSYDTKRARYVARLEPALSLQWAVDVRPGEVTFMGDNFIRREWLGGKTAAINVLKHAAGFLPPWRRRIIPITVVGPKVDRSAPTEGHCLREAAALLAGTPWIDWIEARLKRIGNPPETIVTGLIRKKAVQPFESEHFSYQDTLGWREPLVVRGGLEWREPKGRARVAVTLMRPGDPGWKPREEFLRELRSAGSAPEDAHSLTELVLSSRTAYAGRYTSYVYPQQYLVGALTEVYVTETIVVPAAEGYYLVRYRALRGSFQAFYGSFRRFLSYLDLAPPKREQKT